MPAVIVTSVLKNVGLNHDFIHRGYPAGAVVSSGSGGYRRCKEVENILPRDAADDYTDGVLNGRAHDHRFAEGVWSDLCDDARRAEQQHQSASLLHLGEGVQAVSVRIRLIVGLYLVRCRPALNIAAVASKEEVGIP